MRLEPIRFKKYVITSNGCMVFSTVFHCIIDNNDILDDIILSSGSTNYRKITNEEIRC